MVLLNIWHTRVRAAAEARALGGGLVARARLLVAVAARVQHAAERGRVRFVVRLDGHEQCRRRRRGNAHEPTWTRASVRSTRAVLATYLAYSPSAANERAEVNVHIPATSGVITAAIGHKCAIDSIRARQRAVCSSAVFCNAKRRALDRCCWLKTAIVHRLHVCVLDATRTVEAHRRRWCWRRWCWRWCCRRWCRRGCRCRTCKSTTECIRAGAFIALTHCAIAKRDTVVRCHTCCFARDNFTRKAETQAR